MTQSEFKKIIANAIKAEVAANKFYSSVAKKRKTQASRNCSKNWPTKKPSTGSR